MSKLQLILWLGLFTSITAAGVTSFHSCPSQRGLFKVTAANVESINEPDWAPPRQEAYYWDTWLSDVGFEFKKFLGINQPFELRVFNSFNGINGTYITGRIAEQAPPIDKSNNLSWVANVIDLAQRFLRVRAADVPVKISWADQIWKGCTNGAGYFTAAFASSSSANQPHVRVEALITEPYADEPQVLYSNNSLSYLMKKDTPYVVLSDIDDTILSSSAFDLFDSIIVALRDSIIERSPISGMPEVYKKLQSNHYSVDTREASFIYVTSSSWSLYEIIGAWIEKHNFPSGPLLMQRTGLNNNKFLKRGHLHKIQKIRTLMAASGDLPFLLIGDNGQEDERIYCTAMKEFPNRVKGIFLRSVGEMDLNTRENTSTEKCEGPIYTFSNGAELDKKLTQHFNYLQKKF